MADKAPSLFGVVDITHYRLWLLTAPYNSDKYIFGGGEEGAKVKAKELFEGWAYEPQVKEITGFKHGRGR